MKNTHFILKKNWLVFLSLWEKLSSISFNLTLNSNWCFWNNNINYNLYKAEIKCFNWLWDLATDLSGLVGGKIISMYYLYDESL